MKEVTTYIAEDGLEFSTKKACQKYEQIVSKIGGDIEAPVKMIKELCHSMSCCDECPYYASFSCTCRFGIVDPQQWSF